MLCPGHISCCDSRNGEMRSQLHTSYTPSDFLHCLRLHSSSMQWRQSPLIWEFREQIRDGLWVDDNNNNRSLHLHPAFQLFSALHGNHILQCWHTTLLCTHETAPWWFLFWKKKYFSMSLGLFWRHKWISRSFHCKVWTRSHRKVIATHLQKKKKKDAGNCSTRWKPVRDLVAVFIPFSRWFDRLGEEVEAQISFPLFGCLWSLPTESTLTKSRTPRLMLNWVNKLCMKLCRSL